MAVKDAEEFTSRWKLGQQHFREGQVIDEGMEEW